MDMNLFIDRVLEAAKAAGIETAEVYYTAGENFRASALEGEINQYQVSASQNLSLRGTVNGKMGTSSTQAFDEAAIQQLVEGVKESAALIETDEQDEIYAGDAEYPEIPKTESDVKETSAEAKLALCLAMEKAAKEADERVWKVQRAMVSSGTSTIRMKNSYGLDLTDEGSYCMAYAAPIAKADGKTATGGWMEAGSKFADLDAERIGKKAVEETVCQLGGKPVPGGEYRIIMRFDAMQSLLQTFAGIFSAENVQQNLSLLKGKEGEIIASPVVTLMDDPLLPGGFGSQRFDGEGSASRTKAVIDGGVLTTLLHSRKTARKQGVQSTGNAARMGGVSELLAVKSGVCTAFTYKSLVSTLFGDYTVLDNSNFVRILYGRKPVGNNYCCSAFAKLVKSLLDKNFRGVVKSTCCFVENKNCRILEEYSCDG